MVPSLCRPFVAVLAALLLAACTSLQGAGPYDAAIGSGLDDYQKAMSAFLKAQEQKPTASATLYGSPESDAFYQQSEATLSNIVLHAEAASTAPTCLPKIAERLGLTRAVNNIASSAQFADLAPSDPRFSVSLEDGSCTVVALKAVRANHYILEAMHRKHGRLRPAAAMLAENLLDNSIRIAMRIETAKQG